MSKKRPHIACVMMVRNEEKRLRITLNSIVGVCDSLIMYDTGSTDSTIQVMKDFSAEKRIPLHLITGTFVDFSTSRNVVLKYADTFEEVDFLLLLDCNDEVRNGDILLKEARRVLPLPESAFLTHQQWFSPAITDYWNTRFLKPRCGWYYEGEIHEALTRKEHGDVKVKLNYDFLIYQDRTKDDDKSFKRFHRDKVILLGKYEKDPKHPRTLYYLAQTFSCLDEHEDAYRYYCERTKVKGFYEEDFHAFLKAGEIAERLDRWDEALPLYMGALEVITRAEPLHRIADHYRHRDKFWLAYQFGKLACECEFPREATLFVDKKIYDYERWHVLGIVAYYAGKYHEGKRAVEMALKAGFQKELDVNNLKFYNDKLEQLRLEELKSGGATEVSTSANTNARDTFLLKKFSSYKDRYPNLSDAAITALIKKSWKKKIRELERAEEERTEKERAEKEKEEVKKSRVKKTETAGSQ